jgi:uncharacterized protein (TIGR03083 family)
VNALGRLWSEWARFGQELAPPDWCRPTRCDGWDVRAVYAHHSVFPVALANPPTVSESPGSPLSAAQVLRHFNKPDGVAHTQARRVADSASEQAASLGVEELVGRFSDQGPLTVRRIREADAEQVVPWVTKETPLPVRELVRIVLMEAVVHLLDVQRALDRDPEVDAVALTETVILLAGMAPPIDFVEAATGRLPTSPFPLLQ